jgi:hypothetical protein
MKTLVKPLQYPYFTVVLEKPAAVSRQPCLTLRKDLAEQAIETVSELLSSEDVNLRLRAAQDRLQPSSLAC